jgi:2-dehydro-3-deoxyglucarate aldolase
MDRTNSLRTTLERGGAVLGASVGTFSPTVIETFGGIGLDFAWVDFEHGGPSPYDSTVLENLTRAADVSGTELLVRLPAPDPHLVRKVLDAGVRTILLPRIETAAEVRRVADAMQFTYDGGPGERGIGIGRSSAWGAEIGEYVDEEDESVLLGVMIENETAVDNVDEILAVPEVGFAFVGPADLSVSLGRPMETSHPDVRAAVGRIEDAAADSPVALGGIRNDPADAVAAIESGYQVVRIGGDLSSARAVLSSRLDDIRGE